MVALYSAFNPRIVVSIPGPGYKFCFCFSRAEGVAKPQRLYTHIHAAPPGPGIEPWSLHGESRVLTITPRDPSVYLYLCLFACLSVYLSVYLSVCLFVCLSIFQSVCWSLRLSKPFSRYENACPPNISQRVSHNKKKKRVRWCNG